MAGVYIAGYCKGWWRQPGVNLGRSREDGAAFKGFHQVVGSIQGDTRRMENGLHCADQVVSDNSLICKV
jgi:hypothetical protein